MSKDFDPNDLEARLKADDKSALEHVYIMYREEFLNYAKRYPLSDEDVLDVYQDAMVAMHQNFVVRQVTLERSTIKTYLFGIAKNKIFGYLKTKDKQLQIDKDWEDYEEVVGNDEVLSYYQKQLAHRLSQLSESCREILRLYYYRNLSVQEIVAQTKYKDANTVKSHKSRCMKNLKSLTGN